METWIDRRVELLRARLGAARAATVESVAERLRECEMRCAKYDMTSEEQILGFAAATYLLGDQFDSDADQAWSRDVLTDSAMSADQRGALLVALAELISDERMEESRA